ncbi:hypothetical protein BDN71DRAFT_1452166, partial [Pleurotus eryngii]
MQSRSMVENGLTRGKPKERDAAVATLAEHQFKFCSFRPQPTLRSCTPCLLKHFILIFVWGGPGS